MPPVGRHQTRSEIDIAAPADVVYGVIADPVRWPQFFAPTVHVERTGLGGGHERLRIWATGNGEVRNWTSLRKVDPDQRTVEFRQEVSAPPVRSMGGTWSVSSLGDGGVRLVLLHDFEAVDDDPEGVEWIRRATDENSGLELGNLKRLAESWDRLGELVFSFEDSIHIDAAPEAVYGFLHDAGEWPKRLPHVAAMEFDETPDGVQTMAMRTRAKDGSTHLTESVRVCFPAQRIVYKQVVTPALIAAHTGEWVLEKVDAGVLVRSRHTVTLNEKALDSVPGTAATPATTREVVRDAIGGNSRATLALAKEFAETG
ncbi:aromatase/cyclase [Actinoallomurus purpureus]|uniref:aromatase/cyclase n=1 Tax=Actinoallomurus purpureus TaxID=478114 RepID=UPI002093053B|nr:aromatase/cyclase [Actinoallomurus purpureus]MCO6008429.1 aromatase/cyclase [Actinoallomurus purpureus]